MDLFGDSLLTECSVLHHLNCTLVFKKKKREFGPSEIHNNEITMKYAPVSQTRKTSAFLLGEWEAVIVCGGLECSSSV